MVICRIVACRCLLLLAIEIFVKQFFLPKMVIFRIFSRKLKFRQVKTAVFVLKVPIFILKSNFRSKMTILIISQDVYFYFSRWSFWIRDVLSCNPIHRNWKFLKFLDWFGWPRKRFWWWFLRKLLNSRSLSPFKLDFKWAPIINGTTTWD